jgi:pimeloyl-ACP methyl ester carboxylesterase
MYRLKAVCVSLAWAALVLALAPWLVPFGRTRRGRLEGAFGVEVQTLVVSGIVWLVTRNEIAGYIAGGAAALFVPFCLVAIWCNRTTGDGTGAIGSHFLRAAPTPEATGWADIENEYAWLLFRLLTRFPRVIPADEGRAARARVDELMRATETHPDYRGLARVGDTQGYRLLSGVLDPQHCYSYRPAPRAPGERFGMLVFLHGHGSNLLFVLHALRPLCDRLRLCLVAPTFGYGNWEAPGGSAAVERAARFGYEAFAPDPARVLLMGFSQGGAGVSRAAADRPDRYAGLVFLSATMELPVLGSEAFVSGWKGRNVLVIHGDRDWNVKPATVDAAVQQLEADAVKVAQHRDPAAAHFLFFAQLDAVTDAVCDWAHAALGFPRALQV